MLTEFAKKVLVTGATGLLGRPTFRSFAARTEWQTIGTAFRRVAPGLERADLSRPAEAEALLARTAPDIIIHAAAERRPDVSEREPEATHRLNVEVPAVLAAWAAAHGAFMIYLSTDYVFDGTSPPYRPDSAVNPLNAYGASKLAGERAVLAATPGAAILRVPILYGEVETLGESAVTTLAAAMLAAPEGTSLPMEHWAARYPTHTADVAQVLVQMAERRLAGIFHWSGGERMTKYEMALAMAPLVGFDPVRLVADPAPPSGAPRPQDARLDTSVLDALGIGRRMSFAAALPAILAPHLKKHA